MQDIVRPIARPHHLGWVSRAIVSGFLAGVAALFVLIPAYGFAAAVGSTSPTATPLSHALWNLSHNPITSLVGSVQLVQAIGLHLVVGLGWAVVYAAVVEPKLYGPGYRGDTRGHGQRCQPGDRRRRDRGRAVRSHHRVVIGLLTAE